MAAYDNATTLAPISGDEPGFDVAGRLRRAGRDRAPAARAGLAARRRARSDSPTARSGRATACTSRCGRMPGSTPCSSRRRATRACSRRPGAAAHRARGRLQAAARRCRPPTMREAILALRRVDRPGLRDRPEPFPGLEVHRGRLHGRVRACTARWSSAPPVPVTARIARRSPLRCRRSRCTLRRGGDADRHGGRRQRAGQPGACARAPRPRARDAAASPPLAAGEVITTGTVTDAWPVAPGETWTSDYGALGIPGLTVTFS